MAKIRELHRNQVNFNDVMEIAQDAIMSRLNCHNIGRILEFDKLTQTCTVELMQLKQFNQYTITPAPITQVPLIILGAGGGHITMPNPVGTICLLLFLDRNMDNFMETGEQYVPDTTRMHDFTDAIALTTFTTLANPLNDYDEEAITLFNEGLIEEVSKLSYIKIYPAQIEIQAADGGSINIDDKVELETTAGANITMDDKVSISNSAKDLATLMRAFLLACANIEVNTLTGELKNDSAHAFTDLIAEFAALLKVSGGV